ncbi:MAG: PD40 domain-containing protein [Spirochaetaceae bacterium]|nr:MAG: PD40 domain-containing protein [Spirochaetaceae bacterium]
MNTIRNKPVVNRLFTLFLVILATALLSGCFPNLMAQQQQSVKTDPVYSPDGMKLAFISTHDGDPEIFVMNADGSGLKKLTDNTAVDAAPSWSPDGGKIVFTSDRGGSFELYRMNADGSQQQMIPTPVEGM